MRSFPMQPIVKDEHDVARFQKNRIVYDLWKEGKVDLNTIGIRAADGEYTEAEQMQFAQLIGYSVSGFGDLSYADREVVRRADRLAEKLT